MNIYQSTKVLPYVYQLVHKETNQFYIGFRCANKVPSSEDLGIHYFTSSKYVKELGFENFDYQILAEFFDRLGAIDFEKILIIEHWNDLLNLNKNIGGAKFCNGPKSKETKLKMKAPKSEIHKQNISRALSGNPLSEIRKNNISLALKKYKITKEHKLSLSNSRKLFYKNGGIPPMKNKKHSNQGKENISNGLLTFYSKNEHYKVTNDQKQKISETLKEKYKKGIIINPRLGKQNTKEANEKNRQKALARPKIQCPYCLKIGAKANMVQWHFEKCKNYLLDLNGVPIAGQ